MIRKTDWHTSEAELVAIRREVFIDEQHVPIELEIDDHDPHCHHWLAYINNEAVSTVRMLDNGGIGRMAVRKPFRKQGVGKALLQAAIEYAKEQDWRSLTLSAQDHAINFYVAQGFIAFGDMFMDAGIPHQSMQLLLRESRKLGQDSAIFLPSDNAATALDLCQQARRTLRIFSRSLDPAVYAREDIVSALSALARRHRQSEIRLLICDESPLREQRHPLIELCQRLPSSIPLRVLPFDSQAELNEFFVLADRSGIFVHSESAPETSWCSYFLPPKVSDYQERFDRMWARGEQLRYLRRLY
ncbi:GNAT family N-acetyltransferase [uncultured Zhongshania sp.]|uniref:GNAT family N-acetyltransferase n=1 Tax=uncultured Zhongshania sp. TaxID=1642288 RepID=UPI0030DAC3CF|tara:strand:- start:4176 stop:5078 length:903 start_codon:yes stop_codon:yes gene_type:complete